MNLVKNLCEADARKRHPNYDEYRIFISRLRPIIEDEQLLYYPLFILQNEYYGIKFNSFLDGRVIFDSKQVWKTMPSYRDNFRSR